MKYLKLLFLFLIFSTASTLFSSCGNSADNTEQQGKEYTSAYICPMHCKGSGSDAPGKCPVCKMDYVANKDYKAEDHDHQGDEHEDHDHEGDDHEGHSH